MMVPQPSRTLDHQRKEELILQKQIRQSTAKIKKNLPTLIGRHRAVNEAVFNCHFFFLNNRGISGF